MGELRLSLAIALSSRLAVYSIVLLLTSTAIFFVFFVIVSDPLAGFFPKGGSPELWQRLFDELKRDEPIVEQYANLIVRLFTGDFFTSVAYRPGVDIEEFISGHLLSTLVLYIPAAIIGVASGAIIDYAIVRSKRGPLRLLGRGVALLLFAAPIGGLSLLMLMLSANWGLSFPLRGGYFLPLVAGVFTASAAYLLIAGNMHGATELREHKGVLSGIVLHVRQLLADRDARALTTLYASWLMASVVAIEVVFNRRGLGLLLWDAINLHDLTVTISTVFLMLVVVATTQFAFDVLATTWTFLGRDPRRGRGALHLPTGRSGRVQREGSIVRFVMTRFMTGAMGMFAVIVLASIVVLALAAPWLAAVPNPNDFSSLEPNVVPSWMNPHSPSMDRSPHTGFLHPLGTDHVGRDIYSLILYAAREEVAVALTIAVITLACGLLSSVLVHIARKSSALTSSLFRGVGFIFAEFFMAMPLLVILVAVMVASASPGYWTFEVMLIVAGWAWAPHALSAVHSAMTGPALAGGAARESRGLVDDVKRDLGGIFRLGRFVFVTAYLTFSALAFIGLANPLDTVSWGTILESAYERDAFLLGSWWWTIPPLVMTILMCSSVYLAFTSMGRAANSYFSERP